MGIDISQMSDSELRRLPAEGEWKLSLPGGYPDLGVPAEWRKQLYVDTACQFVEWVLNGVRVEITHEYDPPWDFSGEARRYETDMKTLLELHDTLEDWLTTEYTGESEPGFESGMGWIWRTYEYELEEKLNDRVRDLIESQLGELVEQDDLAREQMWEDIYNVELALQQALRLLAGTMTTYDAWKQYRVQVTAQIEARRRQAEVEQERAAERREMLDRFWQAHFADLADMRIEKTHFKTLNLAERLVDILADTDPDVVEVIADSGLPGDFSNSVTQVIKAMARQALI